MLQIKQKSSQITNMDTSNLHASLTQKIEYKVCKEK